MQQDVVEAIGRALPRWHRRSVKRELQTHLEESRRDLVAAGLSPEEAERESLRRLGDPEVIAAEMSETHRPSRRTRVGLAFGLAGALLVGVYGGGSLASANPQHSVPAVHKVTHQTVATGSHHCAHDHG